MITRIARFRFQRNILVGICIVMLITNLLLVIILQKKSSMTILIPTIDRELKVGTNFVSEEYLRLRADQIIFLLFSMKSSNSDYVKKEILKWVDHSSYLSFKQQLDTLASDITSRGYYYLFTDIKDYKLDTANLKVTISGYLETYLGERQIAKEFKEYELSFINRSGLVLLESFKGIQDEKIN